MAAESFITRRLLPGFEWAAENAYIPPGTHRLLAASGLALGLWGGRHFMDVVVARNSDGTPMTREQAPAVLRPIHGIMPYHRYSDSATDRWKQVVDRFLPAFAGGGVAYLGGRHFFYGHGYSGKPMHALTANAKDTLAKALEGKGSVPLSTAVQLGANAQSDTHRKIAALMYIGGATNGTDKAGGFFPFNHNSWAVSFADGNGIRPYFPEKIPVVGHFFRWMNRTLINNYGTMSLGLTRSMATQARWIEGNLHTQGDPALWCDEVTLRRWARQGLQNFPRASEDDVSRVAATMRGVIEEAWHHIRPLRERGNITAKETGEIYATILGGEGKPGFGALGTDWLLHHSGMNLGQAQITNHGLTTWTSRFFGSNKAEAVVREAYDKSLMERFGIHFEGKINPALSGKQKALFAGTMLAGTAAVVAVGSAVAARINKRNKRLSSGEEITTDQPDPLSPEAKSNGQGNLVDWVNGTPLNIAEWASRTLIVPPSMHRFMGAAYLSGALYLGMKAADAMTGRRLPLLRSGSLANTVLPKEKVWTLLKPIYGVLAYTPGSSIAKDRWRQAAHFLIPVAFGACGNYLGSHLYFKDRIQKLKNPESLADYTDRISMEQSSVFANITALTSIFNTGSGIHLLPFFNYSANLQSRYVMGAGLQVATPGFGKWWSGNPGLLPWGEKRALDYLAHYLGENPEMRPREVPALAHVILAKIYPDMPEQELLGKKRAFMEAIYHVRDTYMVDGKLPPAKQPELAKAMTTLVTGHGFENLLLASGLDPTQANLKSNGFSGAMANSFGRAGRVERLENEFKHKFAERIANQEPGAAQKFLKSLANHSGEAPVATANDNAPFLKDGGPATSLAPQRERQGTVIALANRTVQ